MFKDLKIKYKLIIAFNVVALLASLSGILCVFATFNVIQRYDEAIVVHGFTQGTIGKLMSQISEYNHFVRTSFSSLDEAAEQIAARAEGEAMSAQIEAYLAELDGAFDDMQEQTAIANTRTAWSAYRSQIVDLTNMAIVAGVPNPAGIEQARGLLETSLAPLYTSLHQKLQECMDLKVSVSNAVRNEINTFGNGAVGFAIGIIITAVVVSILLGIFIARSIANPVAACSKRLQVLAHGILREPVPDIHTKDEAGDLAAATRTIVEGLSAVVNDMNYLLHEMSMGNFDVDSHAAEMYIGDFEPLLASMQGINRSLSDALSQIHISSDQVSGGANQVSSGAQALSQGATEQASSVQELAATITEIASHVKNSADNAQSASEMASQVGDSLTTSNARMQELVAAMSDITSNSNEISKIIKTIDDIAFQTNILALNAAVEAARAGAAGKGFAVVADEVRNLASKSAEASKETATLIDSSIQSVNNGKRLADETAHSLGEVIDRAHELVSTIKNISNAAAEQANAIAQVEQGVDQISAVVQTNSATAQQSAAASEELSGQATLLRDLASKFQLRRDTSNASVAPISLHYERMPQYISYSDDNTDKY